MAFRFFAFFGLTVVAACTNPTPQKAKQEDDKVASAPTPVEPGIVANSATTSTPDDISKFIARREQCDHFRGEEAYDEERGRFLREQLAATCKGTDDELATLKRKYASRDDLTEQLSEFEITIE